MTPRDEIIKEICRMNHRILDIFENDRQIDQVEPEVNPNQATVLMMASQVVNTQPNPNQVQISQTNRASPIVVISNDETDDDVIFSPTIAESGQNIEIEENHTVDTNGDISGNTMDELNHVIDNQNIPEMTDAEMTSLSVSRLYMNRLIDSEPRTSLTSRRYDQESGNHNEPKKRRQGKAKTGALKKELIEIGRCELPYLKRKLKSERYTYEEKQAYETVLKMVQTLFGRFSIFEKPNGGSFYVSQYGIRSKVNGDIWSNALCYGYCKHKCPVKLKFIYERERSVYKLYRTGTHNHELTSTKFRLIKNLDDLNVEIYSSKIAPKAK